MRNGATLIKLIKLSQLCHERNIYLIDYSKKIKPNHLNKGKLHLKRMARIF